MPHSRALLFRSAQSLSEVLVWFRTDREDLMNNLRCNLQARFDQDPALRAFARQSLDREPRRSKLRGLLHDISLDPRDDSVVLDRRRDVAGELVRVLQQYCQVRDHQDRSLRRKYAAGLRGRADFAEQLRAANQAHSPEDRQALDLIFESLSQDSPEARAPEWSL